jgi:hypothetical protein
MGTPTAAAASLLVAVSLVASAGLTPGVARADVPDDPWEKGEYRAFASGLVELGIPEHAVLAAGYGKPFYLWGGAQAEGWLGLDFTSFTGSLRANLRAVDLVAGLRTTRTWRIMPLPDEPHHDSVPTGGGFTYRTLDLGASGGLPVPGGLLVWQVQGVHFLDPPQGAQIYEQMMRVVCKPPWCADALAGWLLEARHGALLAGPLADWAFVTGRSGDPFVRVGGALDWRIWPHVKLVAALFYPISSPDHLGAGYNIDGQVALSYSFATGTPAPHFP